MRGTGRGDICAECLRQRSSKTEKPKTHLTARQLAQYIRDSNGLTDSELSDVYNVSIDFIKLAKGYKI